MSSEKTDLGTIKLEIVDSGEESAGGGKRGGKRRRKATSFAEMAESGGGQAMAQAAGGAGMAARGASAGSGLASLATKVASVVAIGLAFVKAKAAIESWSRAVQEASTRLAPFSGAVAAASARSMGSDIMRRAGSGGRAGASVASAMDARTSFLNAFQPLSDAALILKSRLSETSYRIGVALVPVIRDVSLVLVQFGKALTQIVRWWSATVLEKTAKGIAGFVGMNSLDQQIAAWAVGLPIAQGMKGLDESLDKIKAVLDKMDERQAVKNANGFFFGDLEALTGGRWSRPQGA